MNFRGFAYLQYAALRGNRYPRYLEAYVQEDRQGIPAGTTRRALARLLNHCATSVPYYRDLLHVVRFGGGGQMTPEDLLRTLPVLTKDVIRSHFDRLTSADLDRRRWSFNRSGGSTGEPVRLIQDQEYRDQSAAISLFFSHLIGRDVGQLQMLLWGSDRDLLEGTMGWKANLFNALNNTRYLNAFRMTPDLMRAYLRDLNRRRPRMLVAYAQALYELALFAEQEGLEVVQQKAIITSAGTLFPFMREAIERVFGCRVHNRYGSREVGDVACERPGASGLWVAPWGAYVEVVDEAGSPVPAGVEGNLLITSLVNYAMPLIRYQIGDRGVLATVGLDGPQVLERVSGRITDCFRTRTGAIIPAEYFIHMIGVVLNKGDIRRFQLIQKNYEHLHLKLALRQPATVPFDAADIIEKIGLPLGPGCRIDIELVDDIAPSPSGKYRYTVCEVA